MKLLIIAIFLSFFSSSVFSNSIVENDRILTNCMTPTVTNISCLTHKADCTLPEKGIIVANNCDYDCLNRCKDDCQRYDSNSDFNMCIDQCYGMCDCN